MADVKLWLLDCNTYNYLTVCKQMNSGSFKNVINRICLQIIFNILDLASNSLQWLVCHKTQTNKPKKYKFQSWYFLITSCIYKYTLIYLHEQYELIYLWTIKVYRITRKNWYIIYISSLDNMEISFQMRQNIKKKTQVYLSSENDCVRNKLAFSEENHK